MFVIGIVKSKAIVLELLAVYQLAFFSTMLSDGIDPLMNAMIE